MKGNVGCAYLELIFVLDISREQREVRFFGRSDSRYSMSN